MKPGRFAYHDPTTVAEALALLAEHSYDAKVLAGGQSLIPVLNFRLAAPACLIDINGIADLDYIRQEQASLVIGALARHKTVERSPLVRDCVPLLAAAVPFIGHAAIRTRGTIGGSVAHADPAAELPVVLLALDATVVVESLEDGRREIPAAEFFITYMTTALGPTELLTAVRIPHTPAGTGYAFTEVARRSGDFALVSVAALLQLDEQGLIQTARIALGGVGPAPVRTETIEAQLVGAAPGAALFANAAKAAAEGLAPDADLHASVGLRKQLAAALIEDALGSALKRCGGGARACM